MFNILARLLTKYTIRNVLLFKHWIAHLTDWSMVTGYIQNVSAVFTANLTEQFLPNMPNILMSFFDGSVLELQLLIFTLFDPIPQLFMFVIGPFTSWCQSLNLYHAALSLVQEIRGLIQNLCFKLLKMFLVLPVDFILSYFDLFVYFLEFLFWFRLHLLKSQYVSVS